MTDFDLPGTESTSAALRRAEAERDEALAVQKDAVDAFIRITDRCTLLQAELASARTELERLRAACDPYPDPSCGKPTGNASNRCLRALGHDGWCDDDPPVLPYRELERLRTELDAVRTARDNLDRQRAEAIAALASELIEGTRGGMWIVARDGGRDCLRCGQEIRRGEAYEYMPSTDQLQHIHCPDPSTEGAPTA